MGRERRTRPAGPLTRQWWARLGDVALLTAGLAAMTGGPTHAQESQALSYRVRPVAAMDADTIGPRPLRVIQGGRFTWLLQEGADTTVAAAELVLDRNAPLVRGPGPLLVRGWRPPAEPYDTVAFSLTPGDDRRDVAGRPAEHYRLRAVLERRPAPEAVGHRYRVTADLWVLPDLPFSWAPFGAGDTSLPAALPALRDTLQTELEERGLVGRASVRVDFLMLADDVDAGGSERVSGFEIDDLRLAPEPPAPHPVIERSIVDALERIYLEHPRRTCRDASDGDVPAIIRARVDYVLWPPLVDMISSRCRRS